MARRLRDLIEEMVELQRSMWTAAEAAKADPKNKAELNALRRRFTALVPTIDGAIDRDVLLALKPALRDEFRARLTEVRSKIALHQTKWPAILLDTDNRDYRTSVEALIQSNRAFATWALEALQ